MAKGLFITLPKADLEAIRDKAIDLIKEGKTIMRWSSSGTSSDKEWALNPSEMLDECNYALQRRWPHIYGQRITRTIGRFDIQLSNGG